MEGLVFNSVKEYPKMIKICIYREPFAVSHNPRPKKRSNSETSFSSVMRTRTALEDLCICNNFELFCTFTFDPSRYNSKNLLDCRRYMNTWLHNAKFRHSRHLEYLVVPELHKSGAIHFHALLRGYEGQLKDSKHTQHGRKVYNIPHWHFGFSTCCKIDNQDAVSRYIRKYITKDMLLLPGKKRYFCSQRLNRPIKSTNCVTSWLRNVKSDFFLTDDKEFYTVQKSDLPAGFEFPYVGL